NVWEIPLTGGIPRQRTFGNHSLAQISQSASGARWAAVRRTPTDPGTLWVVEAAPGRAAAAFARATRAGWSADGAVCRALSTATPAWPRRAFTAPEAIAIPCKDGHTVHAWVLRSSLAPRRGPAVLMIHGGPHRMYGWAYNHEFQLLASHGYHVVYANLRGSVGYGRTYMRALVGTWGHRDYDDLMRVADVVAGLPFVDAARLAVAGGSYGG